MILTEVFIPQAATPAVGFVHDTESTVTLILHHGGSQWKVVGAIRSGDPEVGHPPDCLELPTQVRVELDLRLQSASSARSRGTYGVGTFPPIRAV